MKCPVKMFVLAITVLATTLLAGCEEIINDGYEVDWAPVEIYIYATDRDGNSIIQPDMPGMSLTFKGETYTVQNWNERYKSQTRAYLARLYGLLAQPETADTISPTYRLYFGEIDGAADMDEDIVLKWPDGTTDTIHYHCSDHKEGKKPKCNRSWKLNGQKHDGNEFRFSGK